MENHSFTIRAQDGLLKICCLVLTVSWLLLPISGVCAADRVEGSDVPVYGYEIIAIYDHDPQAFTQGFCFDHGKLYEGTGLYGQSSLRRMSVDGRGLEIRTLPDYLFGEGVTVFGNRVIQLTWQARTGIVWDRDKLQFIRSFTYNTEGWGITHDGHSLIMSDGSARLAFLDPDTFKLQREIVVTAGDRQITRLNELEYINGEIWANIWKEGYIARINPADGQVTGWVDLRDLARQYAPGDEDSVLNGIAYDPDKSNIYVTGKRWSKMLVIKVVERE